MNGTYSFSSRIGLFHLLVTATHFLEYPCAIRLCILACVSSLILIIVHKIKQLIGNATEECAWRQSILGWLGVWEELGRCLGLLLPSIGILRLNRRVVPGDLYTI